MASERRLLKALVLQGGGALGAFELGAIRVLLDERGFRPDLIAGVSIGAVTALLLARPKNGDPLATLEAFWREVAIRADWLIEPLRGYASVFGNPRFYRARTDIWQIASWTSIYETGPLRETLAQLADLEALADPDAMPRLLVTATDVGAGQIQAFDSGDGGMTLDHILASGSLPPSFPMTHFGGRAYWDGGLFDNTPLGEVIARLDPALACKAERAVVVVNLFPNEGAVPTDLQQVSQRMMGLTFANKTASDLKLLRRFNAVAALLEAIREDPRWADLEASEAFTAADKGYIEVPNVVEITRSGALQAGAWSDFSPATIAALAKLGEAAARTAFEAGVGLPSSGADERALAG
ncbi:patatin-like phospholipase family protein [Phenylobacterium sp.]|uniref:patatin-like phospholipase family protein n=1 Tax=Phenylobacterium sp. TaxID=1871053 RepID=UPI0025EDE45A|nr:patatin-like phospholipase family protein [Phenylobacterium sp.]